MNTYLIISDGKIIREHSDLSAALWDLDFLRLMYPDPKIYKCITERSNSNGSKAPAAAQSDRTQDESRNRMAQENEQSDNELSKG